MALPERVATVKKEVLDAIEKLEKTVADLEELKSSVEGVFGMVDKVADKVRNRTK